MGYLNIENFKSGLDTRRMEVTSEAGSLQILKNGHITRGGEVEKAKALVEKYSVQDTYGFASVRNALYVFGHTTRPIALSADLQYQQLAHPDGLAMTRVHATDIFANKLYVVADYTDGSRLHFFNGINVPDWFYGVVRTAFANNAGTAEHLKTIIDADAVFTATRVGSVVTITGQAGVAFEISAKAVNGTGNAANDQTAVVATTQAAVQGVAEVLSSGSFIITGGTSSPGVNQITSVKVDGVEVLSVAVNWTTSNTATAAAVAAQISAFAAPTYTATNSGSKVTITAAAGTGATPNGRVVAATGTGNVTVGSFTPFAGGVTAVAGPAQISTVTVGGTFEPNDLFSVILNERIYGASRVAGLKAGTIKVHKNKVYASYFENIYFSGVAEPTLWDEESDDPLDQSRTAIGSGVVDLSSQASGFEDVTAIGIYQDKLAFFSRRVTQIWSVDPDPDRNAQIKVLPNIGTQSPDSVASLGDLDLLFLADSGIRSLRARESTNDAFVSDTGTPIDTLIVEHMAMLTQLQIQRAQSVVEPIDGRYWLNLGTTGYVLSYFTSARISAWSTYEQDIEVEQFVLANNRLYARYNDVIYLSGGDDNRQYSNAEFVLGLPYVDGKKQATFKCWASLDIACDGEWEVFINTDPIQPDYWLSVATVNRTTYNLLDTAMQQYGPLIKLKLVNTKPGYARIGSVTLHYEETATT